MSETVRYSGKIKKLKTRNVEDFCERTVRLDYPHYVDIKKSYGSWTELLCSEEYNKYLLVSGDLYVISDLVHHDFADDFCDMKKNAFNEIEFHTAFYNGGACLSEVLESQLSKESK